MAYTTIDKPTDYFNTLTYSGNGSNPRTLTGVGFQPDWVWLKNRTNANGHTLADSVRGANKTLSSDGTGAEVTDKSDGHLDAFTSDGFTVGAGSSSDDRVNDGSYTYVAWNWLAGGTASSNTDGATTSTVSANTTAGFSIVSYTGTGSGTTIGHGLGVKPNFYFLKNRSTTSTWDFFITDTVNSSQNDALGLNSTSASSNSGVTLPTSSVLTLGTGTNQNASGNTYICYCFASIKGFSKFGSYTGNGSTDGTFVYTGFKPAWIMGKRTDTANNWYMFDSTRNTSNPTDKKLRADESSVENANSAKTIDILSNGFKSRSSDEEFNASGGTYIYMAFAEKPFVTSGGIPTTAR